MATRPTYARLRVHQGEVLRDDEGQPVRGTWPELVSESDHYALTERYAVAGPGQVPQRQDGQVPGHRASTGAAGTGATGGCG